MCLPWLAEVEHILKMLDVHNMEKYQLIPDGCNKIMYFKEGCIIVLGLRDKVLVAWGLQGWLL